MFPMAAAFDVQVDKEMTTFAGATHIDNLDAYYKLLRAHAARARLARGRFPRVKDDAINASEVDLRGNNDEELGKEVLYDEHLRGHAVRPLERGHGVVAREDHARRCEGVLPHRSTRQAT